MNILMAGFVNGEGEIGPSSGQSFTVRHKKNSGRNVISFKKVKKIPIVVATSAGDGGRFAAVVDAKTNRAEIALQRLEGGNNITFGDVSFFFMVIEAER